MFSYSLFYSIKRLKKALEFKRYNSLIKNPVLLGSCSAGGALGVFKVPHNAVLGLSFSSNSNIGDITIAVEGGQVLNFKSVSVDRIDSFGYISKSKNIIINRGVSCPSGTLNLYVFDSWMRPYFIGSGIFT